MELARAALLSLLSFAAIAQAQQVIRLDPAAPPGSEGKQYLSKAWKFEVVTNVSSPTLTVFLPEKGTATGAAVIVCPGGGFHILSIDHEGNDVAKWLVKRGIAAFVLRYHLVPTGDDATMELMAKLQDRAKFDAEIDKIIPLSVGDGLAALTYVRQHASEWGLDANRVGILGFSAGGMVTAGTAFSYSAESRPAFVAPIYTEMRTFVDKPLPVDAPPAFIVAASDDRLVAPSKSVDMYNKWTAAGKSAELHLYAKGGHGFGMRKQNLPSDRWIDQFGDWLVQQGFTGR